MKKLLSVILAGTLGCSLVACAEAKEPKKETNQQSVLGCNIDTLIQDVSGEHKCVWEDGKIFYDNFFPPRRQYHKSATLSLQTEYDMWFYFYNHDLDLVNWYYPVEFEYDETKIEIKPNPDKESHFILKVYQPCDQEKINLTITAKRPTDFILDENGEPYTIPVPQTGWITVSTED